jgi:alpha-tubulin suppressor-like RCC1 family protein
MRRPILHLAAAGLVALSLGACTDDIQTTDPTRAGATADRLPGPIIKFPPIDPNQWADITAGHSFSCARKASGAIYCWGRNESGQTGNWGNVWRPRQVKKPNGAAFAAMQLDAGGYHACALEPSGVAFCWGRGNEGQVAAGLGLTGTFGVTEVAGGNLFSSLSAGFMTTCASGQAGFFCWGANHGGGNTVPNRISTFNRYANLAVGALHACAMDTLDPSRPVDCFGGNSAGQTGIPNAAFPHAQVPFTLRAQFTGPVSRVSTQEYFTCVDLQAGTVQCVGDNTRGQLGMLGLQPVGSAWT